MGQRSAVSKGVTQWNTDVQKDFEDYYDDEKMIYWHEMGRQRCVVETICYVHMFRLCKFVKGNVEVVETGAMYQQLHAKQFFYPKIKFLQAAHMLPHQIMVDGQDITLIDPDERTQLGLQNLFGATNVLPTPFNNADLMYEKYGGGRQALADVVQATINGTLMPNPPMKQGNVRMDRSLIHRMYTGVWVPKCHEAFQAGIAWCKDMDKQLDPYFYIPKDRPGEAPRSGEIRFRKRLIRYLEGYDKILLDDTSCLSAWHMSDMEKRFNNPDLEPAVLETNDPTDTRLDAYNYVKNPGF
jgi:hypothetical protein